MKKITLLLITVVLAGCSTSPPKDYYPNGFVSQSEIAESWSGGIAESKEIPSAFIETKENACIGAIYSINQEGEVYDSRIFSFSGHRAASKSLIDDAFDRLKRTKYLSISEHSKPLSTNIVLKYFTADGETKEEHSRLDYVCSQSLPKVEKKQKLKKTTATSNSPVQIIRISMERERDKIYQLYKDALKIDDSLSGMFVFRFVIVPSGELTQLQLVETELNNPDLEKSILEVVEKINFGNIGITEEVEYRFAFFPD